MPVHYIFTNSLEFIAEVFLKLAGYYFFKVG